MGEKLEELQNSFIKREKRSNVHQKKQIFFTMVKHKIMHYRKKQWKAEFFSFQIVCSKIYFKATVEVDTPEDRSFKKLCS